ncbi:MULTISPECIES: hypothetical protein [unclassified Bradyrhizobium]|nr:MULTISPECIES: hypothetical protein [unclassified Bradyrhizobium]
MNNEGEWQRADKPRLYLQAESEDPVERSSDEDEGCVESESSDDDLSWYVARALNFRGGPAE